MKRLILTMALGSLSMPALAQNADIEISPDLIDPGRQLQDRLEQERLENEIERFRSGDDAIQPSLVNPEGENEGPCVVINDIVIEGITILKPDEVDSILKGRFPGCLRRFHISHLMRTLDKAYVDKGFITARTYIPEQNIQDTQVLRLKVVEGKVEDVRLEENGKADAGAGSAVTIWTAFTDQKDQFLNIRDFEQGLEQMNRQASVTAKMRLEPGENPGGSIVVIEQQSKDRYRGFIGFDNLGSQSTGERELRLQMGVDGLISANDVTSLIYVGSTNANAINGAFSIPVGYNTFTASASVSDYLLPLTEISELLSETQAYTLSLDRVINRDTRSITHLSGALRYRKSERFINGVALAPQTTTVGDIRLRHITNLKNARWSWEIGARTGLPWFGGLTDQGIIPAEQAHAEFQAIDFGLTRIGKGGKHGRWSASLRGQVANYSLLGSEQFSLGSQGTVRGFREPLLGGDTGAALRVDGSFPMPKLAKLRAHLPPIISNNYEALARKSSLYIFWDLGGAHSFGAEESRFAAGAGAGYRYFTKRAQFDLGVQSGLADIGDRSFKNGETRITASVTLKTF